MNVIRASELGSCIKAQVARQLGFSPMEAPEKMQAAYERGNVHEHQCAVALGEEGWGIIDIQQQVVLDVLDDWQVVGHLDGRIVGSVADYHNQMDVPGNRWRVWEAKAPNAWDKFRDAYKTGDWSDPLAHRYAWQISVYMLATGLEAYVTCWDEERGVRGFGIEVPPFTLEQVRDRVWQIDNLVNIGTIPDACTQNDWPCPYLYLHEKEDVAEDEVLDQMVTDYERYSAMEKDITAKKKSYQERIREHLAGKDITTAQSKVTFYEQAAPVKYDINSIRLLMNEYGVDIENYRAEPGKPSQRMKITRRGADDAGL